MRPETRRISRRNLLIGAGALATTGSITIGTGIRALQLLSDYHNNEYIAQKDVDENAQPHLKNTIKDSSLLVGVYPDKNNVDNISNPHEFGIIGFFGKWNDWSAKGDIYTFSPGQIPMVSIRPYHYNEKVPFRYQDLVEQKSNIVEQAEYLAPLSQCLFRLEYEMNAPWFAHGSKAQSSQEFIDGWKFVTEIVKKTNPNIQMVWCPNVDYPLGGYYPGSDWVDVVGVDGYNKHHPNILHKRHQYPDPSFAQLFGKDIRTLQDMTETENIPIIIGEVGIDPNHPDSFSWITQAFHSAATYKNVVGVCLFAWNKGMFNWNEANWGNILTPEFRQFLVDNPYYITKLPEEEIHFDTLIG